GLIDLRIEAKGDLHIDEHHTIEDTGIALGEAIAKALGDKRGIERYGFALPMDDAEAKVLIDFGGRNWIVPVFHHKTNTANSLDICCRIALYGNDVSQYTFL
ncbi:MAG: hypothetical protein EOO14_11170, partial [Chitinophagaceae bacterium]